MPVIKISRDPAPWPDLLGPEDSEDAGRRESVLVTGTPEIVFWDDGSSQLPMVLLRFEPVAEDGAPRANIGLPVVAEMSWQALMAAADAMRDMYPDLEGYESCFLKREGGGEEESG